MEAIASIDGSAFIWKVGMRRRDHRSPSKFVSNLESWPRYQRIAGSSLLRFSGGLTNQGHPEPTLGKVLPRRAHRGAPHAVGMVVIRKGEGKSDSIVPFSSGPANCEGCWVIATALGCDRSTSPML